MVTDHYNATQQKLVFDDHEEETRSGRPGRRGAVDSEEEAGHVTATSNQARLLCMKVVLINSVVLLCAVLGFRNNHTTQHDVVRALVCMQKPRRTPKPTREKLEAEEEMMARKQATPSRKAPPATPPSAKARVSLILVLGTRHSLTPFRFGTPRHVSWVATETESDMCLHGLFPARRLPASCQDHLRAQNGRHQDGNAAGSYLRTSKVPPRNPRAASARQQLTAGVPVSLMRMPAAAVGCTPGRFSYPACDTCFRIPTVLATELHLPVRLFLSKAATTTTSTRVWMPCCHWRPEPMRRRPTWTRRRAPTVPLWPPTPRMHRRRTCRRR